MFGDVITINTIYNNLKGLPTSVRAKTSSFAYISCL